MQPFGAEERVKAAPPQALRALRPSRGQSRLRLCPFGLLCGHIVVPKHTPAAGSPIDLASDRGQKWLYFLDLCVSSLRRGHANLLCIVPILTDDSRRRSDRTSAPVVYIHPTHAARTALWGREKRSISRQNTAAVVTNSITTGASAAELLRDATHDGGVPRPASRSNRCCVCVRAVRNGAHADLGDLEAREAARGTRRPACHRRLRSRARARACPSL
jgi:hypothetical protein